MPAWLGRLMFGVFFTEKGDLVIAKLSPKGSIQINDVWVDENRLIYTVDRFAGGLYILEMDI